MYPRRAFTLVELLVVIGIIASLVAMLLPALSKARASAQFVRCASNQRQLVTALLMYTSDNKGFFPGGKVNVNGTVRNNSASWDTVVANPYSLNTLESAGPIFLSRYAKGSAQAPTQFCPADPTPYQFVEPPLAVGYRTSYRYPLSLIYRPDQIFRPDLYIGPLTAQEPQKITSVKHTSKKAVIADAKTYHSRGRFGRPNDLANSTVPIQSDIAIGFADGHVERTNTKELLDTDINWTGRNTSPATAGVKGRDLR